MKTRYFVDIHVYPTGIIKLISDDKIKVIVKTYVGNSKWANFNKEELDVSIKKEIAKEVDKDTAKEFINDFDKQMIVV